MGKGTYQYEVGKTYEEREANCAANGFHFCKNPLEILSYYRNIGKDRYCLIQAYGDMDEDSGKVTCTKIHIAKELTLEELVKHAMAYMVEHPSLENHRMVLRESGSTNGAFVIVRGKNPTASGKKGSILALLQEEKDSNGIESVQVYVVDGKEIKENTWYGINGKCEGMMLE
jgi:hypothetical protein